MKLQLCLCHWASNSAELGLYTTARPCPDHLWPCNLHYSDRVSHRGGSLLLHSVLGKHPLKNKRKREMQRFKELIKVRYSFNSRAGFLSLHREAFLLFQITPNMKISRTRSISLFLSPFPWLHRMFCVLFCITICTQL